MKPKIYRALLAAGFIMLLLVGCATQRNSVLDPKNPTVVVLWNSYNAHAKNVFDGLVMEFNETVGLEKGIVIDSYNYADTKELSDALFNSANDIIGSDPMPNVFTSYPDNAYRIDKLVPLAALDKYFEKEELLKYRSEFLAEGMWGGNPSPKMIPVAKSTEVLYLNKTDWEKFAEASGASTELLYTWEGILKAAELYYDYSGGKPMLGFNPFNDFMSLTTVQLDTEAYVFEENTVTFNYQEEVARKVWDICYIPHMKGWFSSESYASDGVKSGNLIAYLGSSAGAEYFPTEVTIDADRVYPVACEVLPYPTFENKNTYMGQRGANMCITSSDEAHEYAAAEFLKWFTQPEQNMQFAISTGYLPVQNESLLSMEELLSHTSESQNNGAVEKCIGATLENMNESSFIHSKQFDNSYGANDIFQNSIFNKIQKDTKILESRVQGGESKAEVLSSQLQEDAFKAWYGELSVEVARELKKR